MGIFDFFKSKRNPSIEDMMEKASGWTDIYMDRFALQRKPDVKSAAFVFTSWAVWDYCLRNDRLPKGNVANQYIASTLIYSGFGSKIDVVDFLEVFKTRFKIFKTDMTGLSNSDYPRTKQYLPFGIFCSIYKNQLSLNPTAGVNLHDYDTSEELHDFTGGFIKYWNMLLADLEESYK